MRNPSRLSPFGLVAICCCTLALGAFSAGTALGADHGDAPNVAGDQAADLGDTYVFLGDSVDPTTSPSATRSPSSPRPTSRSTTATTTRRTDPHVRSGRAQSA